MLHERTTTYFRSPLHSERVSSYSVTGLCCRIAASVILCTSLPVSCCGRRSRRDGQAGKVTSVEKEITQSSSGAPTHTRGGTVCATSFKCII